MNNKNRLLSQLTWGVLALSGIASAQPVPPGETVLNRPRPDVTALGLRMGSFLLFPQLGIDARYNDNVFAQEHNARNDFIAVVRPALRLQSDWANHEVRFEGNAKIGRYTEHSKENYEDFALSAFGTLDISRGDRVRVRLSHERSHIVRGSSEEIDGANGPTVFRTSSISAGYTHDPGRLTLEIATTLSHLDFDDVSTRFGAINNDDRDRDIASLGARLSYRLAPAYKPFVEGRVNYRDYKTALDDDGFDRDSNGYEIRLGSTFDVTGVTFGEAFAGYVSQHFDDARFDTAEAFELGGKLTWTPSGLTTVTAMAERGIDATVNTGASSLISTRVGVRVDHELLRTLILTAEAAALIEDFESIDREDTVYEAAVGAKYFLSRYVHLTSRYNYTRRESDGAAADRDFSRNIVWIRIEVQL